MKILVVGKGGREHALVTALNESASKPELFAFPGSDAIHQVAQPAGASDLPSLVAFMKAEGIGLCVAGEESYLVKGDGLANMCGEAGIPCWGPPKEAAQLEASKEFAKEFMIRHRIPTGGYRAADTAQAARNAIAGYPCVLKFDGLAAGKGVAICPDEAAANAFIDEVFETRRFGEGRLLIEEFLEGPEVSIFVSVVDEKYQILTPARDYKRLRDGDAGPNTGGMGAVASRALIGGALKRSIEESIVAPTVAGLQADGLPYRGFLYFGIMLTKDGPKILEYNCRFGDPEAQAVLPLIRGDFAAYVGEAARGSLDPGLISLADDQWSVCLVMASHGYPASSRSGDVISGLEKVSGARVYHAGTRRNADGAFETNGGRVLAVVCRGDSRESAVDSAYAEAAGVTFDGAQMRSDIGRLHF